MPAQIVVADAPILTLSGNNGLTVKVLLSPIVPHEPPLVVSVNVIDAGAVAEAVYVVVLGVLPVLFVKLPPAPPSVHTADVAPPPNDPPNAPEVLPWQMAVTATPAFTVGAGFTVIVLLANIVPHEPPAVVSVNVTDAGAVAEAV